MRFMLAAFPLVTAGVLWGCSEVQHQAAASEEDSCGFALQPDHDGGPAAVANPVCESRDPPMTGHVRKSDAEWREMLTARQYRITRQKGTEPAFTGEYWDTKTPGTYVCVCCGQPLFRSESKLDSASGWPSFCAPVEGENVTAETDRSLGMVRTEVLCSRCDAHLGHVFSDGPPPAGLRYCINSASLRLLEEEPSE